MERGRFRAHAPKPSVRAATGSRARCERPSSSVRERTRAFAPETASPSGRLRGRAGPRVGHRGPLCAGRRVGAYLPAGRFPLTASAFMTVGVAKEAGVPTVIACTPPQPDGGANDAVLYAAHLSGRDRVFAIGGVQALAAMAFGLLEEVPGRHAGRRRERLSSPRRSGSCSAPWRSTCSPARPRSPCSPTRPPTRSWWPQTCSVRPSTAPNSPAALDHDLRSSSARPSIDRRRATARTRSPPRDIAGPAWRDYGSITVARDRDPAIAADGRSRHRTPGGA